MNADILVIDDEADIRDLLKSMLTDESYVVETAASAEEALQYLTSDCPPLILCDYRMPGKNGLEFVTEVRNLGIKCAIVMITANDEKETIIQAMRLGTNDFVVKPFKADQLIPLVADWVNLGKRLQTLNKDNNPAYIEKQLGIIDLIKVKTHIDSKKKGA
ncbi:MAG: response regulator [Bacteriovoracaceae bacterium]